jgi:hypothetical protein
VKKIGASVAKNFSTAYVQLLQELMRETPCELWLTGGTLLSYSLRIKYFGDIDLLLDCRQEDLISTLRAKNIPIEKTFFGSIRIRFFDGNTADLYPNEGFASHLAILDHLSRFDYSCVSQAINLVDGRHLRTAQCIADLNSRQFRLNREYVYDEQHTISNLKRYFAYQRYFGLSCTDGHTISSIEHWQALIVSSGALGGRLKTLAYVHADVARMLGDGPAIVPCRGIVRNAVLNSVTIWDDYDVLTDITSTDCKTLLSRRGISFTENYFGMPKARTRLSIVSIKAIYYLLCQLCFGLGWFV